MPDGARGRRRRRGAMDLDLITQADYARHRGVSRQAVSKAVAAKKIPVRVRQGRKLIDAAEADFALGFSHARLNTPAAAIEQSPVEAEAPAPRSQTDGLTA